jgi:hypothetical protein
MTEIEIRKTPLASQVERVLLCRIPNRRIVDCLTPGVRRQERKPLRITLFHTNLARVINRRGFGDSIRHGRIQRIRPPCLYLRRCTGAGRRLIRVVGAIEFGSLRSDISQFHHQTPADSALHVEAPLLRISVGKLLLKPFTPSAACGTVDRFAGKSPFNVSAGACPAAFWKTYNARNGVFNDIPVKLFVSFVS